MTAMTRRQFLATLPEETRALNEIMSFVEKEIAMGIEFGEQDPGLEWRVDIHRPLEVYTQLVRDGLVKMEPKRYPSNSYTRLFYPDGNSIIFRLTESGYVKWLKTGLTSDIEYIRTGSFYR